MSAGVVVGPGTLIRPPSGAVHMVDVYNTAVDKATTCCGKGVGVARQRVRDAEGYHGINVCPECRRWLYEWLLAEARYEAEDYRDAWHDEITPAERVERFPLPWERT